MRPLLASRLAPAIPWLALATAVAGVVLWGVLASAAGEGEDEQRREASGVGDVADGVGAACDLCSMDCGDCGDCSGCDCGGADCNCAQVRPRKTRGLPFAWVGLLLPAAFLAVWRGRAGP